MNRVETNWDKSDYLIYDDYLNFQIDGQFLDELLQEYYPGPEFQGLIPTLLSWMALVEERVVVWQRILPAEKTISRCPILMCPDDCDFSCSLIIAEIEVKDQKVYWHRIGLNRTYAVDPEKVADTVEWLAEIPPFTFELENYQAMMAVFKKELVQKKVESYK